VDPNAETSASSGWLRRLQLFGAVLLAILLAGEGLLWFGSLFVGERPATSRPDASYQILSVGDSHTFGAGLPPEGSYPAQLQVRLDAIAPGEYAVINLGIPGMSTTQVRERLAVNVARYRPDLVIFWCGVNNVWNRRIRSPSLVGWGAWLDSLGIHSRLYRLGRVMLHDRELDRAEIVTRADGAHQEYETSERLGERVTFVFPKEGGGQERYEGNPRETRWVLRHGGVVEHFEHQHGPRRRGPACETGRPAIWCRWWSGCERPGSTRSWSATHYTPGPMSGRTRGSPSRASVLPFRSSTQACRWGGFRRTNRSG
jgi:hypothetical protein